MPLRGSCAVPVGSLRGGLAVVLYGILKGGLDLTDQVTGSKTTLVTKMEKFMMKTKTRIPRWLKLDAANKENLICRSEAKDPLSSPLES